MHMKKPFQQLVLLLFLISFQGLSSFAQEDNTSYIDPTIGNVSRFLVPTYPTMHLPNQMLRMFPSKRDYISDEVEAFPLQVAAHRNKGLFQMKVTRGEITEDSWNDHMNIDHDLEVVSPWFYSTYLIEDDIRVSFTPGKKCAIYKLEFPEDEKKNILIQGSKEFTANSAEAGILNMQDKIKYTSRGIFSETRVMTVFSYVILADEQGNPIPTAEFEMGDGQLSIWLPEDAASTVLVKYAISYIGYDQAKYNYNQELDHMSFDQLSGNGKKIWKKTVDQIRVEGGTGAQKRTFYTSLYRTL